MTAVGAEALFSANNAASVLRHNLKGGLFLKAVIRL
jgi:hypothetical protein